MADVCLTHASTDNTNCLIENNEDETDISSQTSVYFSVQEKAGKQYKIPCSQVSRYRTDRKFAASTMILTEESRTLCQVNSCDLLFEKRQFSHSFHRLMMFRSSLSRYD